MNVSQKTIQGVGWVSISQVIRQIFTILISVCLARLLTPKDFGLIAMIVVVTNFINIFKDFGLTYAIIQKKDLTQEQLSTSFWLNVFVGLVLALILFTVSSAVASFYNEPNLKSITMFLSSTFFISSLGIIHSSLLSKEMKFNFLSMIEITATAIAGITAIIMAFFGFGIWALVGQQIVSCAIFSILIWIAVPWKPKYIFKWGSLRRFFNFGLNLTGFNFVNYFSRNLDNLIVGKFLGAGLLGFYDLAYKLLMLPIQQISTVLGKVMFPALSALQDDKAAVRKGYLKGAKYIAVISFPLMIGLLVLAPELVRVIFGPQWERSIFLVRVFALIGLLQSVGSTVGWIYTSRGRTDIMFRWGIFSLLTGLPFFIIGLKWSIEGVAVAYALAGLLLTYPSFSIPFKLVDLRIGEFLLQFKEISLLSFAMGVSVFLIRFFLKYSLRADDLMVLIICILLGITIYSGLLFLFTKNLYSELIRLIARVKPGDLRGGLDVIR